MNEAEDRHPHREYITPDEELVAKYISWLDHVGGNPKTFVLGLGIIPPGESFAWCLEAVELYPDGRDTVWGELYGASSVERLQGLRNDSFNCQTGGYLSGDLATIQKWIDEMPVIMSLLPK